MKLVDFIFLSFIVALRTRSKAVSDNEVLESAIALNVSVIFNLIVAIFKYRIISIPNGYSVWLIGCLILVSVIYISFRVRYLQNKMLPERFHELKNKLEKRRPYLIGLVGLLLVGSYTLILWPIKL